MRALAVQAITRRLAVLVYFIAVLTPVALLSHDGPWPGRDDIAIRGRTPFPERLAPRSFKDFDDWFADRLGFRYPLIYAATELHVGLLRRPLDRHIFFGRDGWMFWTDDRNTTPATMADARGKLRFSQGEIGRIDAGLRAAADAFAACKIPAVVLIAPNKQSIYGEFLFGSEARPPPSRLDHLLGALSERARSFVIDPRGAMREAKRVHAPVLLYPKTDIHWDALGAFYGYRALMQALAPGLPAPNPEALALDYYRITSAPYPGGDMAVRVLFSPWRFPDEDVTMRPKTPLPDPEVIQVDRGHILVRSAQGSGRIIVFGDSFSIALVPFLALQFHEVHSYAAAELDGAVVAQQHPSAVVFETLESYADKLLEPTHNLDRLCEK